MKRDGGPAFPAVRFSDSGDKGMSLRDWFAGMALQGLIGISNGLSASALPAAAYELADAMLKRREAKP